MAEKRYAIVRVNICPEEFEEGKKNSRFCPEDGDCEKCRYGDTKEQLIRKVAQVIYEAKLERYRQVWRCECSEIEKRSRYRDSLALARKIVEFLGVEE